MNVYRVKKGIKLDNNLILSVTKEIFGNAELSDEKIDASFGSLKDISVWIDKKGLAIETVSSKEVSDEIAADTIKKFNTLIYRLTGYTAKERIKNARKGGYT